MLIAQALLSVMAISKYILRKLTADANAKLKLDKMTLFLRVFIITLSTAKGSDLTRTNSMKTAENGPQLSKARWMNLQDERHGTLCSDTIAGGF